MFLSEEIKEKIRKSVFFCYVLDKRLQTFMSAHYWLLKDKHDP